MLLSELLRPDLIKVGIEAKTPNETISELVDVLVQEHEVSLAQRGEVIDVICLAEDDRGSGMADGIAIPHGTTDAVEDMLCVLGTAPDGIDFKSPDGSPAKLVILLVAPKRNFVGEIKMLAGIKHLLDHDGLKEGIISRSDAQAIFDLIEQEEHKSADVNAS